MLQRKLSNATNSNNSLYSNNYAHYSTKPWHQWSMVLDLVDGVVPIVLVDAKASPLAKPGLLCTHPLSDTDLSSHLKTCQEFL